MRARITAAVAVLGAGVLLLVIGAAGRPLLFDDRADPMPILNAVEIGFAQDMLAHHNQALMMVERLDTGADPAVRALAERIDDTQRGEIGQLIAWLRLAGAPTVNPEPMAWMHPVPDNAGHHGGPPDSRPEHPAGTLMPGMASRDELDALAAARGEQAAILFLQLMQRHHYGGIDMAAAADRLLDSGVVKQTARDMLSSQGQEAGIMGMLLSQSDR